MKRVPEAELQAQYEADGFLVIRGFASPAECASMKQRMGELIAKWDPETERGEAFTCQDLGGHQNRGDYFLDSSDRVHFFPEESAVDERGVLKEGLDKRHSLNKVGHALHVLDDVFGAYSQSHKVCDLVAQLGYSDPVLPQSMYIFKSPSLGGEVPSHQDSTFLHTEPRLTCAGLWLALDAATTQNGCVWVRPGSHREALRRRFVRNAAHFADGDASAQKIVFRDLEGGGATTGAAWEGKMPAMTPEGLRDCGFVPAECRAGDLLVIHGQVDHLSLSNSSALPRETFQLHFVEGPGQGITWSAENWLQYPEGKPFPSLRYAGGQKDAPEVSLQTDSAFPGA